MKKVLFVLALCFLMVSQNGTSQETAQKNPGEGSIPMPSPPCEVRGGNLEIGYNGFVPFVYWVDEYCVQTSYCVCEL